MSRCNQFCLADTCLDIRQTCICCLSSSRRFLCVDEADNSSCKLLWMLNQPIVRPTLRNIHQTAWYGKVVLLPSCQRASVIMSAPAQQSGNFDSGSCRCHVQNSCHSNPKPEAVCLEEDVVQPMEGAWDAKLNLKHSPTQPAKNNLLQTTWGMNTCGRFTVATSYANSKMLKGDLIAVV